MSVLTLQVFVSLMLVLGSVILLLVSVKLGDHEHADRLTLLPLEDDDPSGARAPADDTQKNEDTPSGRNGRST
jgi:hypothetical protein